MMSTVGDVAPCETIVDREVEAVGARVSGIGIVFNMVPLNSLGRGYR